MDNLIYNGDIEPFTLSVKDIHPGTELIKVFGLLDRSSTPHSKGAVICMKSELSAIDRDNYIAPVWMI